MTNAPIALRIHDGTGSLPEEAQPLIVKWLRANRINPDQVSITHPVTVLTVPYGAGVEDDTDWLMQIIVFHQFYVGPDGDREMDLLTRQPVCFQRTVPLAVAFPTPPDPASGNPSQDQNSQDGQGGQDSRDGGEPDPPQGAPAPEPVEAGAP